MTRLVAVAAALAALGLLVPAAAGAAGVPAQDDPPADPDGTDSDPTDPDDELPDGARTIIGSPDPGPDPEHSGERGGWAQLLLFGVMAGGVGFILWRVLRAARTAPASVTPPDRPRSP